jgi:hypothetical protein
LRKSTTTTRLLAPLVLDRRLVAPIWSLRSHPAQSTKLSTLPATARAPLVAGVRHERHDLLALEREQDAALPAERVGIIEGPLGLQVVAELFLGAGRERAVGPG